MSIGPVVWYAWWKPFLLDDFTGKRYFPNGYINAGSGYKFTPSFLYGPAVSLGFLDRFRLSCVFIYGDGYHMKSRYGTYYFFRDETYYNTHNLKITKYDLDATLSYIISDNFSVFGGFKYQRYKYPETRIVPSLDFTGTNIRRISYQTRAPGFGLGAAVIIPVADALNLSVNFSGLYLRSTTAYSFKEAYLSGDSYWMKEVGKYNACGGNTGITLSYKIRSINTTISVGFRYQFLKYIPADYSERIDATYFGKTPYSYLLDKAYAQISERRINMTPDDRLYDHFYGITLMALYSFEI